MINEAELLSLPHHALNLPSSISIFMINLWREVDTSSQSRDRETWIYLEMRRGKSKAGLSI